MVDLKTGRPSSYDGLYGYINLSRWVEDKGSIVVKEFATDHTELRNSLSKYLVPTY